MGVRGLTTFVNSNQHLFLKYHLLHDTNLVIDGHSLCARLYSYISRSSAFGGDYDRYAVCVRKFFKGLKKCNLCCYVLFDGSYETRKLRTAYFRLKSKIKGASKLDALKTQKNLQIFPLLLRDVFKQVLTELKIPYTVCEFEADAEIAAMARYLDCPVLSYDSDFYIYNVIYIPFDKVDFAPTAFEENGNKFYALKCKIYKVRYLVDNLGGLREEMLPLFATLLGNDYVQKRAFKNFFGHLKLPKGKNEQQRSIYGLLKWLQNETLDTAVEKIVGRIKKARKKNVLYTIIKSMEGYTKTHCRSLQYFNLSDDKNTASGILNNFKDFSKSDTCSGDESDSSAEDNASNSGESGDTSSKENDEQKTPEKQCAELPEWFSERLRQNIIPQLYIDYYTLHLHFFTPQAEDYTDEDASLATVVFLRYAFDILTDFTQEDLMFVSRDTNCSYKKILVGPDQSISRPISKNYGDLLVNELRIYFDHFIRETMTSLDLCLIESLPSNFRLTMLSILWWVAKCSVPKAFVHSLFIGYVMLDVIDDRTGTMRSLEYVKNRFEEKLKKLRKLPPGSGNDKLLNKNKVSYNDSLVAASVLLQHFDVSPEIKKRPRSYDVKRIHKFAQFQCCLQQFICLNSLSGSPYEETKCFKLYNGTFVYNIARLLDRQSDPISFLEQYLKGAHTVLCLYKGLCWVYEQCAAQLSIGTSNSMFVGKKRKNRKNAEEISVLTDVFESERRLHQKLYGYAPHDSLTLNTVIPQRAMERALLGISVMDDVRNYVILPYPSENQGFKSQPALDLEQYYDMSGEKLMVIFNHFEYKHTPFFGRSTPRVRKGTSADVKSLCNVFEGLGFKLDVHQDLDYEKIVDVVAEVSKRDHSQTSCVVVVILTHGSSGGELMAADRPYYFKDVLEHFQNGHQTLLGKPKLFFLQACRGSNVDSGRVMYDGHNSTAYLIPTHADFLILYATVEDYVSWRNKNDGSWLIQELCAVLEDHARDLDLLSMITLVNRRVALELTSYNLQDLTLHDKKEMPETHFTLTKMLRF